MKWKDVDVGACDYYITATFTEWLPLFRREDIRRIVCEEIKRCLLDVNADLLAYVLMPDHLHILVLLPTDGLLHRFCRLWRGRSARRSIDVLTAEENEQLLQVLARHANGGNRYAVWKEQVRALAIWDERKLRAKADYIHANPVRLGLVTVPEEWLFSSYRSYMQGRKIYMG
jgi:REP element-mobilizing transposase RayT